MKTEFRVKAYKHPRLKYVVRGKVNGKWLRTYFPTKAEALTYAQQENTKLLNQGIEAVDFPSWLRVMALHCDKILQPFGKTIQDATEHFAEYLKSTQASVLVDQALAELVKSRESTGATKKYCYDLKFHIGRLRDEFPNKKVSEFTTKELDHWLSALPFAPVTKNTFRRDLRTLFSFCISRDYCSKNPAEQTRLAKEVSKPVEILTVDQTIGLLHAADEKIIPFLALGAFAGLRTAELIKLDWSEVDLKSGHIEISAKNSKTARRRLVKIQPNLDAWLRPYANNHGAIVGLGLRQMVEEARKEAKINKWPSNALRHSFASYHLAQFNDAAALALQMGHTNTNMIFQHYREVVKPKSAARFWKIKPAKQSKKVVQFKAA